MNGSLTGLLGFFFIRSRRLDIDRSTWVLVIISYPRVIAARLGPAVVHWVSVVEEPPEGELVEPVVVPVDILVALRPLVILRPQFVRINWVKVTCVRLILDGWLVWSLLCSESGAEVNVCKERVRLDVVRTILPDSPVVACAKREDEVASLLRKSRLARNRHKLVPVDHLVLSLSRCVCKEGRLSD